MGRISQKSVTLWRIRLYIIAVVCAVVTSLFLPPFSKWWYIVTAVWVAAFMFMYFFYYPVKYNRIRYSAESDGTFRLTGGVIYRYERYINVKNIQYVNFIADPVQRVLGLQGALILTPGSRLYIPCLDKQKSQELLELFGR